MGIKKLKEENKNLSLTLIDMLGRFDISKTKKYTQFLVNELKKTNFDSINISFSNTDLVDQLFKDGNLEDEITKSVICNILGHLNLNSFIEFCNLMEKGLVEEKDISTYDSWDKVMFELYKAKNKEVFKNSKKETKIIVETKDFIILKPLSHAASCAYGYNTKWCTAMVNDPEYFYRHSKGILVYVLDQKNKTKFGFYSPLEPSDFSDEDMIFTIWNETGKQIDSIQTELPNNILGILLNEFKYNKEPNYKLFSDNEIKNMLKHTVLDDERPSHILPRVVPIRTRFERTTPSIINYVTTTTNDTFELSNKFFGENKEEQ